MSISFLWSKPGRGGIRSLVSGTLVGLILLPAISLSRTIIVAQDGSGEFTTVGGGCAAAEAGDTVLVRDGSYGHLTVLVVDSAVVLIAEHPGLVEIYGHEQSVVLISLRGTGQIIGCTIRGAGDHRQQYLVYIPSGPVRLHNCEFIPGTTSGSELLIESRGYPPEISYCNFHQFGSNRAVWLSDSTDLFMPNNYFGTQDTVWIHQARIHDGRDMGGLGFVTISPVWDHFEWLELSARNRTPHPAQSARLEVFPNPTNGLATIHFEAPWLGNKINVFDILGRRVDFFSRTADDRSFISLNLNGVPNGVYWVEMSDGRQRLITKIQIAK